MVTRGTAPMKRKSTADIAPGLRLRPLRPADEGPFRAAHEQLAAEYPFGLGYTPGMPWRAYLRALAGQRAGLNLPQDHVPSTFLVADVAGEIVGRVSIRHQLNGKLRQEGGHIGYCVLRQHRRRGYATEMLRQSLIIARAEGVERVLVTCDDDNFGSAAVIEACGGELDTVALLPGRTVPIRRYWIG